MAISYVGAGAVVRNAVNPTLTVPAGVVERDLLIIITTSAGASTVPTGWTTRFVGANVNISIFYKFADATNPSVTVTNSSGVGSLTAVMIAYRGVGASDTISAVKNATATSIATNTLVTSFPNEYVISVYTSDSNTNTWGVPASTTARVNQGAVNAANGLLVVDELQAVAGTSTIRTATVTTSRLLSCISFAIIPGGENKYWVGGTGTWNTTSTTNWSLTSGGAGGAIPPGQNDTTIFDQASTYTVTMTGALACFDMTVSAGTVTFATGTAPTLAVSANMTLVAGTIWTNTGAISFTQVIGTTRTITTNGVTINSPITFVGTGGSAGIWSLGSALTTSTTVTTTLTGGALALNGFNLSTGSFSSNNSNGRAITFGTNSIYLTNTTPGQTVLDMAVVTNYSFVGTQSFISDASVTKTYTFGTTGGTAANAPNLSITSGAAVPTFTTGSWFNLLDFTGSSTTPAASVINVDSINLSTGGTYNSLGITMVSTGTITPNGKTVAALTVNNGAGTVTLAGALGCTTYTHTAGTIDFATFNLTCSAGASYAAGTLNNIGTISCTTWTETGTFALSSGTISASTSFTVTSGAFTYNVGGTISTPVFVHTAGTVALNQALTLTTSYTLTAGTLTLGSNLTTGSFITTGTGVRAIAFSTNQILLTGNNATIWDGGGANISYTGTVTIVSNYTGSVGTRTINVGTGWTEATAFDVKAGSAVGISIGTSGTDTVAIAGNLDTLDLTGMNFTYSPGVMTVYVDYTIPSTGGTVSASANTTTFASTNVTPRIITVSRSIDFPITFSGVGGTFNLSTSLTTGATRTTTIVSGTIGLNGFDLTTGIFASTGTATRAIAFGSNNIILSSATPATTVLSFATATGFTYTGTGGFTSDAAVTKTYVFGTTGGTLTNAPNLTLTGSGTAIQTFTTASWFDNLDFGSTAFAVPVTALNIAGSLTLSSGGTFTSLSVNILGTGTITPNGKTIAAFTVNNGAGTVTLAGALGVTTYTQTAGTIDFATFNLTGSGAAAYIAGTLTNIGTITCTSWTVTGAFTFGQGTITPSTSFVLTSGSFTYNSGATLSPVPTFTHTAGTVTLGQNYSLTSTGTYTLVAGTLNMTDRNLIAAAFITSGTGVRAINFGTSGYGEITVTGNNTTIWDGGGANITYTGNPRIVATYTGATGTRTVNLGTSWTEATAFDVQMQPGSYPNVYGFQIINGSTDIIAMSGVAENVSLTGFLFTFTPGVMTVYGDYTIDATGGTVSASASLTTFATTSSKTITISRTIDFPITFSGVGGTFNLGANLTTGATRTTTLTSGTLVLNGYNYSTGLFSSAGALARAINFGTNSITVSGSGTVWTTATITNLQITGTPVVNVTNASATATSVLPGALPENQSISFNFTAGSYALTFLNTAGYTAKNVNFTGFVGTLAATAACTVYGSYTISSGMTVTASANVLTFGATSGTNIITASGKTMPPITIDGLGGTFNISGSLTTSGLFRVLAGTFSTTVSNHNITCTQFDSSTNTSARSISLNGSTVTISSTAGITLDSTNLTFDAGTSQITLTNATSTVISFIGGGTFYNVSCTGGGTVALSTVNTYNNLTLTNGPTVPSVVTVSDTQTINGVFASVSTNASTRLTLQSIIDGVQETVSAGSVSLSDVDFQDIYAAGATIPWTGTRLGNLGNNINITFGTSNTRYWSLAAGGNWNAIAWATSSGGTPSVDNFPLPQDTCIIENTGLNTSATITINANWNIGSMNMSSRTNAMTLAIGVTTPFIYGSWINGSGYTITGTGTVNFVGQDAIQTITGSAITFTPNININTVAQTVQLGSALTMGATSTFTLTSGVLSLNGYNLTTGIFSSNNTNTRTIQFGSNNIVLSHTTAATTVLSMANTTGFNYTGTGGFTSGMSVTRTFTCGTTAGGVPPNLALTSGASIPTLTSGSTFNILDFTGSTCIPAATVVNLNSDLVLASGGTYTALSVSMNGAGTNTITGNSKTIAALTFTAGTNSIVDTLTCTTFNINGADFNFASGTLTPTTSFNLIIGSFTYGGTATLGATPTFVQTAGTVTFSKTYALSATGTYTLTGGTLTLNGFDLTTGIFSSNNGNTRTIEFGTNNIVLSHTTAAQTVLSMANTTGFNNTGTGGFTSAMGVTRTFNCSTTPSVSGSILFNGSQYLSITSATPLVFGTGDFTIESWINMNSVSGIQSLWSETSPSIIFALSGTNIYLQNDNSATVSSSGANIETGVWTHVACVRISGVVTFYINGIAKGGGSYTANFDGTTQYRIGLGRTSSGSFFNGYISNFRVVKGLGVYTGDFSPSTSPLTATQPAGTNISAITGTQTSLLLNTPNNASFKQDFSTYNFTLTNNGTATSNASTPITVFPPAGVPPNLAINSGASIPTITTNSTFNILDFTGSTCTPAAAVVNVVEGLTLASGGTYTSLGVTSIGLTSIITNAKTIAALLISYNGNPTLTGSLNCTTLTVNGGYFDLSNTVTLTPSTSITITTGTFIYGGTATLASVATFTQTGGAVTLKAYSLTATGTYTFTSGTLTLTGDLTTGIFSSSNTNNRTIFFDIYNIILSTTTAAATVLNMPDSTGFLFNGTGGFTSPMSVTRTFTVGTASSVSGSLSFNGIDTQLTYAASNANLVFGTGDFTVEAWIKMNDVNGIQAIWSVSGGTASGISTFFFGTSGSGLYLEYSASTTGIQLNASNAGITSNVWTHVAVVRISGVATIYVNGVFKTSGAWAYNYAANGVGRLGAGRGSTGASEINGYISNFRIVKGVGVYTDDFTPSPSPLTATQQAGTNINAITGTQTSLLLNSQFNASYLADSSTYNLTATNSNVTSNASTPITVFPAGGVPPNLALTSGASTPTITTGGYLNKLDFTGSTCIPAATVVNLNSDLVLASGGTYTGLGVTIRDDSTITPNGKTIAAFTVNTSSGTVTLAGALAATTYTQTAGTMDFATFNLTCSGAVSYAGGILSNIGTITCTTFTLSGADFTFSSGTITPSTSFVVTSGAFTYNSPAVLSVVPTFTHTAGNVTLNQAYSLSATGTYTLNSGTLSLTGNLTTGIFSSTNTNLRSISFGTNDIILSHTTAAQTVLSMANQTNFSCSGTGGFASPMSVSRTFTSGTTAAVSGSILFNGTNQYLSIPTSTQFDFGSDDFTVECWIYPILFNAIDGSFMNVGAQSGGAAWSIRATDTGLLEFTTWSSGSTVAVNITSASGALVFNTWSHVAVTRNGSTWNIWVNGVSVATATDASSIGNTGRPAYIAYGFSSGAARYQNCYISNVRWVKGVAVYTGNFTVPVSPLTAAQSAGTNISAVSITQTSLLLNTPNNGFFLTDGSINNFTVTNNNTATANALTPITVLPAAGIPPNLRLTSGASVPTLTTGSNYNILDFTGSSTTPPATSLNIASGLTLSSGGTYTGLTISSTGATNFTGNNKTIAALSLNNGSSTTTVDTTGLVVSGAVTMPQGALLLNGNLSSTSLSCAGSSRSITGTNTTYTITGSGTSAWNYSPTGSVLFNGTTQYLSTPNNAALQLATATPFTIEAWIYSTNMSATDHGIIGKRQTGAEWQLNIHPSFGYLNFWNGVTTYQSNITLVVSTWYHVAVTWDTTTLRFFVNGVMGTTYTGFTVSPSTNQVIVGGTGPGASGLFAGNISNLRLVKGVAVYTGNFTVPTGPLTATQTANPYGGSNTSAITGTQTSLLLNTRNYYDYTTDSSTYSLPVTNNNSAAYSATSPGFTTGTSGFTCSDFTINMTSATAKTFVGGVGTYPTLNHGGGAALTISGTNTFDNITNTISGATVTFPTATTTTFNNFSLYGSSTGGGAATGYPLGSVSFNGSTQYLTAAYNLSLVQWWDTDYTIEMWIYNNTNAQSSPGLVPLQIGYGSPTSTGTYWSFGTNAAGNLYFYYYNGAAVATAVSSSTVPLNSWNHVTMVYTNSNTTLTGYINGVQAFSVAKSGTPQAPSGNTLNIGSIQNTKYNGYISNVRIVRGVAVYTGNFTVPLDPLSATQSASTNIAAITGTQTSLLLNTPNSANFIRDSSTNNFTVTNVGTATANSSSPFLCYINSTTSGTSATITKSSGTVYGSSLSIQDSTATGGATWYAGPTSLNVSNNTGWIFNQLPIINMGSLSIDGGVTFSNDPI